MGSGVYADGNKQYQKYLDDCLSFIKESNPELIIICGGFTNPHLEISEAESIKAYFIAQHPSINPYTVTENKSLTSLENLENAYEIIHSQDIELSELHICCDSIRSPKNFYCAAQIFNKKLDINASEEEIYHKLGDEMLRNKTKIRERITMKFKELYIEGMPLDRSIDEIAEQIPSSILEIGFYTFQSLHKKFIQVRKDKLGLK